MGYSLPHVENKKAPVASLRRGFEFLQPKQGPGVQTMLQIGGFRSVFFLGRFACAITLTRPITRNASVLAGGGKGGVKRIETKKPDADFSGRASFVSMLEHSIGGGAVLFMADYLEPYQW
jgi:hypothetical protein